MSGDGVKKKQTIYVRWVRSGIGFSVSQKRMIRSLGLRRLNHVVELEDTPSNRGLVAKISHLVEITTPLPPSQASIPEYVLRPPSAKPTVAAKPGKTGKPAEPSTVAAASGETVAPEATGETPAADAAATAKPKRTRKKKTGGEQASGDSPAAPEKSEE